MNTISLKPTMIELSNGRALLEPRPDLAHGKRGPGPARGVTWLPVPSLPTARKPGARTKKADLWLGPPRSTLGEKVMMSVLTAAALGSVIYGVVCLLQLVENWAAVHQSIAQLVQ